MDKRDNFNFNNGSALHKETNANKSFVKKVQSRVTGLLPSSLSKWFGGDNSQKATTRQRDEDDEVYIQPPSKRIKIPTPDTKSTYANSYSSTYINDLSLQTLNDTSHAKRLFEPVAGPSGIQSNKPNLEANFAKDSLLNGDKDSESGESTDGFVQLRFNHASNTTSPNKETKSILNITSPNTSHNRTLFSDRSSTPQMNTSLSSRRPSFNVSTFGSPNFVDRTLSTKRILNSPFYKGRTIYGGASAYTAQNRNRAERQSLRNPVQVTAVNKSTGNDATLSETARRILHALEEFRSPLSDAQKIPAPTRRSRPDGILSKYTGANPYTKDAKIPLVLNKELQVPTVPDLLKMKLKERLQDSTVAVRQIATSSKSVLNKDDYKLRVEDETPKHSNKIKNKITTTRQQKPEVQVEEVKLPDIALPITTLPKFDFSLPPPPSSSKQPLITIACKDPPKIAEMHEKSEETKVDGDNVQYKFSNPLVLAENLISIIAINDFKFSDPVFKQKDKDKPSPDIAVNFKTSSDVIQLKRKVPSEAPAAAKLPKNDVDEKKTSEISLDKFKPAPETWECSTCLIRNVPEKQKCAACETPKPQITQKVGSGKSGFGEEFKMSMDKWECSACMVRNLNNISNCVACSNPKPVKDNKTNGSILVCNPPPAANNTFGDKFKISSNVWVCPTCMIQNKNELEKCAACETQKPGAKPTLSSNNFGDAFKKKTNEWECSICMIRNPNEKDSCVACETPKPGSKPAAPEVKKQENIPVFNFGIFPSTKNVTKTSEITPIVTPSITVNTPATTSASIPTFTFGIPTKPTPTPAVPVNQSNKDQTDSVEVTTSEANKPPEKEMPKEKPAVQKEPPKPFVSTGGFTFGNFSKPNNEVSTPPKSQENALSKPIITSPPQSAFTFNPTSSAPSLKRNLNDADSTTEAKKELITSSASSIVFSPDPNLLKPPTSQVNLLNPEKNLFGSVVKTQPSVAVTTQTPALTNSSFSFTAPQTQPPSTSALPTNLFTFGAKTTATSLFGNTTTTTTTQAPVFKFNQPESTNTPPSFGVNAETQPQPSMFGKPTNSIFGMSAKPAFESTASAPTPAFGVTAPGFGAEIKPTASPAFGGEIKPPTALPVFGGEIKQPIAPPSFGSDLKQTPAFGSEIKPLAPSAFGSTDMKQFTFGARPNEEQSKPVFAFGSAPAKPPEPAKPVSFNFAGATNQPPQPAAPSGGFSFSNNNNNATPAPGFNFSSPKVEANSLFQSSTPAANIFNTPLSSQTQPIQNGGFNFGSASNANNNMKTGFNFGATNQFNPAPPPTAPGVFSFGSNANPTPAPAPAPAAGGFNFGQNATPTPAFNVNMTPNFNFTAGNLPPTFSATSDNNSPAMQQRRRLKAVRRNQR